MPAYAKISLVTSVFHPSDVAFVQSWSRVAPGLGGWQAVLDQQPDTAQVDIVPPGAEDPVFRITRPTVEVVVERLRPAGRGDAVEVGRFRGLRDAVLALCPISDDALEEINSDLAERFPRAGRD